MWHFVAIGLILAGDFALIALVECCHSRSADAKLDTRKE
jgi:hypothetical protein